MVPDTLSLTDTLNLRGSIMCTLTDKQIEGLRQKVRITWIKWFILGMSVFMLWAAGMKIYFAWKICQYYGYCMIGLISEFQMHETYQGSWCIARDHIVEAFLSGTVCIFMLTCFFTINPRIKQNKLLLHLIDQDKARSENNATS